MQELKNKAAPNNRIRLNEEAILKIKKMTNYIEIVKGIRCDYNKAIDMMYDAMKESDPGIKQLARDMEYCSGRGRIAEKYGKKQ